ncbi:MAG TPA: cupin domain-containing protein [Candidatus Udaeobacter sp.]|nr:cupin domain-containing protein [Candidatus Udaeobacter sp.]
MNNLTRRNFIGAAAVMAGGLAGLQRVVGAELPGVDRSRTDPGPQNPQLDAQNPDSMWPPATDSKSLVQNFKYPFSFANKRIYEGGWSREVTVRELPVSKTMAGVNMRLTAGGFRELHWHTSGEWAIMLYGNARITAIDLEGKSFVADVGQNDLWFFPSGIPHSIQGLEPDGAEFMLVFDDGDFSESETVLLSDAVAHLPHEVLAKNFGVRQEGLRNLPKEELFIFQSDLPASLENDQRVAAGTRGNSPQNFAFRTMQMQPTFKTKGGEVRIVDSSNFKPSTTAMALVTVHPGGLRELHWHPNADEWQYYIGGQGRMTVVSTGNKARTMDFQAGDVGYVQKTLLHYIENTGDMDLVFLEMFGKVDRFQDLSFSEWLAHTPPEAVMAHLNIDKATYDTIPKNGGVIIPLT